MSNKALVLSCALFKSRKGLKLVLKSAPKFFTRNEKEQLCGQ